MPEGVSPPPSEMQGYADTTLQHPQTDASVEDIETGDYEMQGSESEYVSENAPSLLLNA